jgi:LysR family hydrogen peroxide-inducible transcriptional activator
MLLLGTGHCFRDHVLEVCPEFARFSSDAEGIRKSFEGSSLETIKHMVASGMGVTLVPRLSVPKDAQAAGRKPSSTCDDDREAFVPRTSRFEAATRRCVRRVVLAWRPQLHALRGHRRPSRNLKIYACEEICRACPRRLHATGT